MRFGNLALIKLLLDEYVEIVSTCGGSLIQDTSYSGLSSGSVFAQNYSGVFDDSNDDFEEKLEEIEDEIMILVADDNSKNNKKRSNDVSTSTIRKRFKKNDRKPVWTNASTQVREH
mmetsp:Transcript_20525/g.41071  ORF Transcript_20525/g.41071 Transcript_20525/m.41071 type:complete len:116 (-) Transcript_20525:234-581(-)|eukprot:CAMPEP_0194331276 /NCGR_PEP_ID=MMETSP0171-20130528/55043_1 /TAXON_ID=218684 /ORGANISM="Corethron pennatum, Strain L29A3" /LENGTH=115 /DNA_ID=CAMNT_0039092697 /DNA_START=444 /DNA_END=791 /DNA_ORIENTATION=-